MSRVCKDILRNLNFEQVQYSPKYITASEIRKSFIDFFSEDHKHIHVPSSPVFSLKDPTLAFVNAGMNQFKSIFLGTARAPFSRVVNYQKCIRISGTHNDLNQVGQDGYHHTFFEMLGNWSFGDYFKEEACQMSWDLLTRIYKIPTERLYVTYFGGDDSLGLKPDLEVLHIWRKIGVKDSHIIPFGAQENFWTGGTTGPCGTCTEIHYDHVLGRTEAGHLVNAGSQEVTELWNLVFTQYNRTETGELKKLKTHFIDTGMGFERLVALLQGKTCNYETDLFLPLFDVIRKETGHSGYTGKYDDNEMDKNYRILADHSRMIAVALSDGMIPNHHSKVRKIIRRAITVAENVFHSNSVLLKNLTTEVAESLADAYPQIEKNLQKIHYILDCEADVMKQNEKNALKDWEKFKKLYPGLNREDIAVSHKTLKGLDYIRKIMGNEKKTFLSNDHILKLVYTYGISIEEVFKIARALGLDVNISSYKKYEAETKAKEKKSYETKYLTSGSEYSYLDVIAKVEENKIRPTYDYFKYNYKVDEKGEYIFESQPTTIEAIICNNSLLDEISIENISEEKPIGLILDRTQLFAKDDNQDCDHGVLEIENKIIFDINNVIKIKGYVLHMGHFREFPSDGKVTVSSIGVLKLDEKRRVNIMRNHTALHLMNFFLRNELFVFGEKESMVTPEKLSLNYMVYKNSLKMPEGIADLEKSVNNFIRDKVSVKRQILNHVQFHHSDNIDYAPKDGLLEPEINVIQINSGFKLSREFCTGTHVLNTSDIKDFVVTKFTKGSYSVHTIEAAAGERSLQIRKKDSHMKGMCNALSNEISESKEFSLAKIENWLEKLQQIYTEFNNSCDSISYLTTTELQSFYYKTKGKLHLLRKSAVRNFLAEEIDRVSDTNSDSFNVHCIKTSWGFKPEDIDTSFVPKKPTFFICRKDKSIAVHCLIPQSFVSKKFNAQQWLTESLLLIKGTAYSEADGKPELSCFCLQIDVTDAQLRHIMDTAVDVAKKNFRN